MGKTYRNSKTGLHEKKIGKGRFISTSEEKSIDFIPRKLRTKMVNKFIYDNILI